MAVASGGYAAQRVDLGDASVWVVNDEQQSVGRANTAVHELNAVVETGGAASEILQQGATVLVLDRDRASAGILDPTTSTVTETVAVPPTSPRSRWRVTASWSRLAFRLVGAAVQEFADFDSEAEPVLNSAPVP